MLQSVQSLTNVPVPDFTTNLHFFRFGVYWTTTGHLPISAALLSKMTEGEGYMFDCFRIVLYIHWGKSLPVEVTPWCTPSWSANSSSVSQNFPAFYRSRKFITAFTRACHMFLSWDRSSQSMSPIFFFKYNFNIIIPPTSRSSKWYPSFRFCHQNPVSTSLLP